ncbi:hypothetical protein ACH3XW_24630 [Acanthocheilonema viteae]
MNMLLLLMANFACILAKKKATEFGLIPDDIICPFCIALIQKFQQTTQQNSDYKNVLCESISAKSRKNYHYCMESFNEMTVEKLKTQSAEELCKNQKLCPIQYKKVILLANTGKDDFQTIPVVTEEQLKNAKKYNILKTIGDVLTGKIESSSDKNLTLHIDLEFRKSELDEMAVSENSTTISTLIDSNST